MQALCAIHLPSAEFHFWILDQSQKACEAMRVNIVYTGKWRCGMTSLYS